MHAHARDGVDTTTKEAVSRKKGAKTAMFQNSTEEIKRRHKSMKNKAISKVMIVKVE